MTTQYIQLAQACAFSGLLIFVGAVFAYEGERAMRFLAKGEKR